jgi:alpha-glucosidase
MIDLNVSPDNTEFVLKFKNRTILEHKSTHPCIYLAHNDPAFRMHPRSVANYKVKNQIMDKRGLTRFTIKKSGQIITFIFDNELKLTIQVEHGRLTIKPELTVEGKAHLPTFNHFIFNLLADPKEAIYGCGEQFSFLNLRGRCVPLWTQEPGIGKNRFSIYKYVADMVMGAGGEWWTTYYPQPTFVSSQNYFVHVDSYAFAEFDFQDPNRHSLRLNEIPTRIVIDIQENALQTIDSLTLFLGRQRPLPDWILDGVILGIGGGLMDNDLNSVPAKIERAKKANTKIAAIWSEDWTGLRKFKAQTRLFWNWKHSMEMYPDLPNYIKELRAEGIRYLGYNNCFLMMDGDLYQYARDHGYLVKNRNGNPYELMMFSFQAVMLDLTNPGCWIWFKELIKEHMIGCGLDGWMCDFAEYLPIDAVVHSGQDPYIHHNEYPVLWAKINAEAVKEAGRDSGENSIIFFSRSGNYGTTKHSPLIWSGDQVMTFWLDMGLPAAICSAISLGFVGVGQTHADIAGEFGILWFRRTKELFMRWTEYGAFTPVMRTHEAKGHSGWTLDTDTETLDHFAKFSRIHAALKPYLLQAISEYSETGVPLIRHCYLHYENDPTFHSKKPRSLQYQYLLGRDLLVAPVYVKKATTRKLYLPQDQWIHLWSDQEFSGGWITIAAPIGQPPVFYRKLSSFVPLFKKLQEQ